MSEKNKSIPHFKKWFDADGNLKEKYGLNISDGYGLISDLCRFGNIDEHSEKMKKCNYIIKKIIKDDLFFKLFKYGNRTVNAEDNKTEFKKPKIDICFSLFQLLLYSLKVFKNGYSEWYICNRGNLLNDILALVRCLFKLSTKDQITDIGVSENEHNNLIRKFKQSGILDYTSSYDIVLGVETKDQTANIFEEIELETKRIREPENEKKDTEFNIYNNENEKRIYEEIIHHIKLFCTNMQTNMDTMPVSLTPVKAPSIKSKGSLKKSKSREIIKGNIILLRTTPTPTPTPNPTPKPSSNKRRKTYRKKVSDFFKKYSRKKV
jgi:hypothetical protein